MTQPIIEVKNLSKEYILSHNTQPYYTLRDSLIGFAKKPLELFSKKGKADNKEKFLALNDVNFSVMPGEVIGIIGKNGAGKSTLLKILSQITPPTKGSIHLRGRVASLLEVGTGFHPELTGRENIYLNGAILGMTQKEIKSKFDEIVEFAGIEKFLDTPVKRYSSGMYVRLAFAVAAHLEPEILIVDEVLAVGDAEFQKKCMGKMGEVAKGGRTVLFVSHNMEAIKRLCQNVILLEKGIIIRNGKAGEVIDYYLNNNRKNTAIINFNSKKNKIVEITKISILNKNIEPSSNILVGENLFVEVEYEFYQPAAKLLFSVIFKSDDEIILYSSESDKKLATNDYAVGKYRTLVEIPAFIFNVGTFNFDVHIHSVFGNLEYEEDIIFEIIDVEKNPRSRFRINHDLGKTAYVLEYTSSKIN